MDVIATVEQQTGPAVDVTDGGGGRDDVRKAPGRLVRHFVFLPHDPSAVYLRPPATSPVGPQGPPEGPSARGRTVVPIAVRVIRKWPRRGNQTVRPQSLHRQAGEPCGGALHPHRRD